MLAARTYGIKDIRTEEIPVPEIKKDEILIAVKAAAICGTDVRMLQYGAKNITAETPLVQGHEVSGVIARVGADVTAYKEGQRVAVAPNFGCGVCGPCVRGDSHLCAGYRALGIHLDGGFAEYMLVPGRAVAAGNITLLADSVSFEEAAVNEALSCAYNGSERCAVRPGDDVLVIGAGPIGIMHAMLAKMAGAGRVFINDLSAERLSVCKSVDENFITVQHDIREAIAEATGGEGVQVCITACPAPAAQALALELCGVNGRINFFGGIPAEKEPVAVNTNLIHYKQLIVSGTTRASLTQFRKTLQFISTGILNVKPLITAVMPLSKIGEGFDRAAAGDGLKNVIIM